MPSVLLPGLSTSHRQSRGALLTFGSMLVSLVLLGSLVGCGGFTAVDVGGTVTGLHGSGLQLANAGSIISLDPTASTFVFPNQVEIRAPYLISVVAQPARQTCSVSNGVGMAGAAPVTAVNVVCVQNSHALSGRVTGLTSPDLILTNGSDHLMVAGSNARGDVSFTFATPVADGAVYGVAVLTQPTNQTCAVVNGTAVMGSNAVDSVQVNCR